MSLPNAVARSFLLRTKACSVISKVTFTAPFESDIVSVMVLSDRGLTLTSTYPSYRYEGPHMRHRRYSAPENATATLFPEWPC